MKSHICYRWYGRPYSKSKLELESNSSEILPVNCMLVCGSYPT